MSLVTNGVRVSSGRRPVTPKQQHAEDYYALVHWLRAGGASALAPRNVGVTACRHGAGASTVAENIAVVVAEICDRNVLLLDLSGHGRQRGTRAANRADAPRSPAELARPTEVPNLFVLKSTDLEDGGRLEFDPAAIHELMRSLDADFGYVVVDLPTTESAFCCQAAGVLNGVLLVIEAERTRFEAAARAKNRLFQGQANVLGIVLNNHPQHLPKWLDARL